MTMVSIPVRIKNVAMLFAAALCGWVIAVGSHASWQVPVESAQVLAGLVTYPLDNPFYLYHVKLWTLVNQAAALLLTVGVPELSVSFLIEGAIGSLTFSAIFLIVYSICGKPVIALFTPLFMYALNLVGLAVAYPIYLLGTSHSYGIVGLSFTVLVIGVLGVGRYRTGAFLAGMAPALHPSLGTFCVIVAACTIVLNYRTLKSTLPRMLMSFCLGAGVTLTSLWWQSRYFALGPVLDGDRKQQYIKSFIENYDFHRPLSGWSHGGLLVGLLILFAAIRLVCHDDLSIGARIVASAVAASLVITVAIVALADFVPPFAFLKILIPWRYLNLAQLCLVPIVIGFLASSTSYLPRFKGVVLLLVPLVSLFWIKYTSVDPAWLYGSLALAVILLSGKWSLDIPEPLFGPLSRQLERVITLGCIVLVATCVVPSGKALFSGNLMLEDRTNTEIIRIASMRPGMLLTAGEMHLVQLATRRPVLLDGGGLDFFCYVPESGPRLNEIMRKVYGMDIFVPLPEQVRNCGVIPMIHRQLWEERTQEEWRLLRREFGVTDIFTPASWELQLPRITAGNGLVLYAIP